MVILFDLDQTLVNSNTVQSYRDQRQWRSVMALIHRITVYPGITEMLNSLQHSGHRIAVVTSSPRLYCDRLLYHLSLATYIEATVCYHDTRNHKPHPEPVLFAMERLGADPAQSVMIGDEDRDISAGRAAGTITVLASWGGASPVTVQPDMICGAPQEVVQFIALYSTRSTVN